MEDPGENLNRDSKCGELKTCEPKNARNCTLCFLYRGTVPGREGRLTSEVRRKALRGEKGGGRKGDPTNGGGEMHARQGKATRRA